MSLVPKRFAITPQKVPQNRRIIPPSVTIDSGNLRYILGESLTKFQARDRWQTPASIFLTIFITILVSDFKDNFGLTGDQWQAISVFALVACLIWLGQTLVKIRKSPSQEDILHLIYEQSSTRNRRDAVFFIRAKDKSGTIKFLVYLDKVWDCYFCPYMKIPDNTNVNDVTYRNYISSIFDVRASDVSIIELDDLSLSSQKKSERTGQLTDYNFHFIFVKIGSPSERDIVAEEFVRHGRTYSWKTLEEAEEHEESYLKNGDVLKHYRDNYSHLFIGSDLPLSIQRPIDSDNG